MCFYSPCSIIFARIYWRRKYHIEQEPKIKRKYVVNNMPNEDRNEQDNQDQGDNGDNEDDDLL